MILKTGRLPRIYIPGVPHMSALRGLALPIPIPSAIDYTEGMPEKIGHMLNNILACCTASAYCHALQIWSFHTNKINGMITQPDGNVQKLYEGSCGYIPGQKSTDLGGIEQKVLIYLLNTGAPTGPGGLTRHKLRAFVEIDPRNDDDIREAIYSCGCVYVGFNVPEHIMARNIPKIWEYKKDSRIKGGHAVIWHGYDDDGYKTTSWERHDFEMTVEFKNMYVDEAYAMVDINWFEATGKTILGLTVKELTAQMAMLSAQVKNDSRI
jgi:hypothetical protein